MKADTAALPIEPILPDIHQALSTARSLILAAPPGAGKTSRVPLALAGLLDGFKPFDGRILLLQPRRIAARLAAERLAKTLGEPVGKRIGLSTRIERKLSTDCQIEVMTDGVFVRRLLTQPDLDGVSAVLFDEIHERTLNMDMGLALAREVQSVLREDLALALMSATLDADAFKKAFDAPAIVSEGRQYPIETHYLGRTRDRPETQMAVAVKRALRETDGSILAFLPGAGEIRRTAERLEGEVDADIAPLFGALGPKDQDRAIRPAPKGQRKIVLATDIAESSLTIEGVSVVVDLGLARRPKQNANGFGTSLVTERASRANVDQRRGRAGRLGPGVCYRLWDEAETRGLTPSPTPELLTADLSGLRLTLAAYGEADPLRLPWLDPPPEGRLIAAKERLQRLGALTDAGELTAIGRDMADLPLPPDLAALVVSAAPGAERALAAELAVLLGEPGLGGPGPDLLERLRRFRAERSSRANVLRRQAQRWAGNADPSGEVNSILAKAWPDRIAYRRAGGTSWLLSSGTAGTLSDESNLAKSDWLVVADLAGGASTPRITQAVAIQESDVRKLHPPIVEEVAQFDPKAGSFHARKRERIGAIVLSETPLPRPSGQAAKQAWLDHVKIEGFASVGLDSAVKVFLARLMCLHTALGEGNDPPTIEGLQSSVEEWLGPVLSVKRFSAPTPKQVQHALAQKLNWTEQTALNSQAPLTLTLPTGRRAEVDWLDDRAPLLEARVQEFFGTTTHPRLAKGRVSVTLQFISPGGKPVATTQDLAGFWAGGYADMAKDMRGRYPKHDWPYDPAAAKPHPGLTKARLGKS